MEDSNSEDYEAALRKAKGGAGLDGWHSEELKVLPQQPMRRYARVAKSWEDVLTAPEYIRQSKQTSIPKPAKVADGKVAPENIRPVSIFSMFWRAWTKAWVGSESVEEYMKATMPPTFAVGRGQMGSEEAAASLNASYLRHGFMGTADYSMGFDYMDPTVSIWLLKELGWPE